MFIYYSFRILLFTVLSFLTFTLSPVQAAQMDTSDSLHIENIWAMPCSEDDNTLLAFMHIENTLEDQAVALTNASSPMTSSAYFIAYDGTCEGEPVEHIDIPSADHIDLQAADYAILMEVDEQHIMADVHHEAFSLTLTFALLDDEMNVSDETMDVIVGVPVRDEAPEPSDILIVNAWARPTSSQMMNDHSHDEHMADEADDDEVDENNHMDAPMFPSAAYMRLLNRGDTADRLISAESSAANVTEIHETAIENDVMRMSQIEGLDLTPGEWVAMQPGGYHIMLIDLKRELLQGDAILLTLRFESGTELTIAVPVYDMTMMSMEMGE